MSLKKQFTSGHSPWLQWGLLLLLSAALAGLLAAIHIPAALLLGPMIAAIILTAGGGQVAIPGTGYALAQAVVGCMIAQVLPRSLAGYTAGQWPIFITGVAAVIAASGILGWAMIRLRLLPGSTVVWGLSPGAATAMVVLAENYGADVQLVAFMQYLRVILVALAASLVASFFNLNPLPAAHAAPWFPAPHWTALAQTLALAGLGTLAARWRKFRSGALLLPLLLGGLLSYAGWITLELPRWLLASGYAFIGWKVGCGFTRPLLLHALKMLPRVLLCTLALMAACGGLAGLLVWAAKVDPLTAYLATSPGGADTMAIIAASSNADAPFVMGMQTLRFLSVLFLGPVMARWVIQLTATPAPATLSNVRQPKP